MCARKSALRIGLLCILWVDQGSDFTDDAHPCADCVAWQVGEGKILTLDSFQRGWIGAGGNGLVARNGFRFGQKRISRHVPENTIHLAADLRSRGANCVGHSAVRHSEDF